MSRLRDKVIIVTGAAGGIGSAAVRLFLANGAKVHAVDLSAEELKAEFGSLDSSKVSFAEADVTREDHVDAYMQDAFDRYGSIDGIVVNAGVFGGLVPLTEYSTELFDKVMSVNLRGAWLGLRSGFKYLKESSGGSIVLTSSVQGLAAIAESSAYTASKHAVVGMMKGAALEGARYNIRVNSVHPGIIDTKMMGDIHLSQASAGGSAEEVKAEWNKSVPLRRHGTPIEIASLMLFLLSDESSYCTGATYLADGGMLATWTQTAV